ncbi:MAG: hypothetical protein A2Z77_00920 [Chloroflexi bacterium RBG_13_51_36]|nr:MAG: hypothetical protein A2Z77_00920 [Chloroflexi bacterium RBG_13_51_36]
MTHRELRFTHEADKQLTVIENNPSLKGVQKQVRKTLRYLETNLRSKSLQTHEYQSLSRRYGIKVFEAYVQQKTPGAYRVFWHYGPDEIGKDGKRIPIITIIAMTPHPD